MQDIASEKKDVTVKGGKQVQILDINSLIWDRSLIIKLTHHQITKSKEFFDILGKQKDSRDNACIVSKDEKHE